MTAARHRREVVSRISRRGGHDGDVGAGKMLSAPFGIVGEEIEMRRRDAAAHEGHCGLVIASLASPERGQWRAGEKNAAADMNRDRFYLRRGAPWRGAAAIAWQQGQPRADRAGDLVEIFPRLPEAIEIGAAAPRFQRRLEFII